MKRLMFISTQINDNIQHEIKELLINPNMDTIKVLFVPTAANEKQYEELIPFYFQQLQDCGILPGNIITYNCDRFISKEELDQYRIIFFCPGNVEYLMKKINETEINESIQNAVRDDMFFIGISTVGYIAFKYINPDLRGLNLISVRYECVDKKPDEIGSILDKTDVIRLGKKDALVVRGKKVYIVG